MLYLLVHVFRISIKLLIKIYMLFLIGYVGKEMVPLPYLEP